MLSLRKPSQDINESTCKWVPLVPLNKEWSDDEVHKYFKLSCEDIKLIQETNIVGYKNIKSTSLEISIKKKDEPVKSIPKRVFKSKIKEE
jgi:hypothetical protein